MERKFSLEVERRIGVSKVTLRGEVTDSEDISETIKALNAELDKSIDVNTVSNSASIQPMVSMPLGLSPSPQLTSDVPEMPSLANPPHSYNPVAAIDEILNPQQSIWARQPRGVKEIKQRLIELGVRGVSDQATFDGTVRGMFGAGKIKREKVNGLWKYYKLPGDAS